MKDAKDMDQEGSVVGAGADESKAVASGGGANVGQEEAERVAEDAKEPKGVASGDASGGPAEGVDKQAAEVAGSGQEATEEEGAKDPDVVASEGGANAGQGDEVNVGGTEEPKEVAPGDAKGGQAESARKDGAVEVAGSGQEVMDEEGPKEPEVMASGGGGNVGPEEAVKAEDEEESKGRVQVGTKDGQMETTGGNAAEVAGGGQEAMEEEDQKEPEMMAPGGGTNVGREEVVKIEGVEETTKAEETTGGVPGDANSGQAEPVGEDDTAEGGGDENDDASNDNVTLGAAVAQARQAAVEQRGGSGRPNPLRHHLLQTALNLARNTRESKTRERHMGTSGRSRPLGSVGEQGQRGGPGRRRPPGVTGQKCQDFEEAARRRDDDVDKKKGGTIKKKGGTIEQKDDGDNDDGGQKGDDNDNNNNVDSLTRCDGAGKGEQDNDKKKKAEVGNDGGKGGTIKQETKETGGSKEKEGGAIKLTNKQTEKGGGGGNDGGSAKGRGGNENDDDEGEQDQGNDKKDEDAGNDEAKHGKTKQKKKGRGSDEGDGVSSASSATTAKQLSDVTTAKQMSDAEMRRLGPNFLFRPSPKNVGVKRWNFGPFKFRSDVSDMTTTAGDGPHNLVLLYTTGIRKIAGVNKIDPTPQAVEDFFDASTRKRAGGKPMSYQVLVKNDDKKRTNGRFAGYARPHSGPYKQAQTLFDVPSNAIAVQAKHNTAHAQEVLDWIGIGLDKDDIKGMSVFAFYRQNSVGWAHCDNEHSLLVCLRGKKHVHMSVGYGYQYEIKKFRGFLREEYDPEEDGWTSLTLMPYQAVLIPSGTYHWTANEIDNGLGLSLTFFLKGKAGRRVKVPVNVSGHRRPTQSQPPPHQSSSKRKAELDASSHSKRLRRSTRNKDQAASVSSHDDRDKETPDSRHSTRSVMTTVTRSGDGDWFCNKCSNSRAYTSFKSLQCHVRKVHAKSLKVADRDAYEHGLLDVGSLPGVNSPGRQVIRHEREENRRRQRSFNADLQASAMDQVTAAIEKGIDAIRKDRSIAADLESNMRHGLVVDTLKDQFKTSTALLQQSNDEKFDAMERRQRRFRKAMEEDRRASSIATNKLMSEIRRGEERRELLKNAALDREQGRGREALLEERLKGQERQMDMERRMRKEMEQVRENAMKYRERAAADSAVRDVLTRQLTQESQRSRLWMGNFLAMNVMMSQAAGYGRHGARLRGSGAHQGFPGLAGPHMGGLIGPSPMQQTLMPPPASHGHHDRRDDHDRGQRRRRGSRSPPRHHDDRRDHRRRGSRSPRRGRSPTRGHSTRRDRSPGQDRSRGRSPTRGRSPRRHPPPPIKTNVAIIATATAVHPLVVIPRVAILFTPLPRPSNTARQLPFHRHRRPATGMTAAAQTTTDGTDAPLHTKKCALVKDDVKMVTKWFPNRHQFPSWTKKPCHHTPIHDDGRTIEVRHQVPNLNRQQHPTIQP